MFIWLVVCYGMPSDLLFGEQVDPATEAAICYAILSSVSGVHQGDVEGGDYFDLALMGAIEAAADQHPECLLIGYHDDVPITGHTDSLEGCRQACEQAIAPLQLGLQPTKVAVWSPRGVPRELVDALPEGVAVHPKSQIEPNAVERWKRSQGATAYEPLQTNVNTRQGGDEVITYGVVKVPGNIIFFLLIELSCAQ